MANWQGVEKSFMGSPCDNGVQGFLKNLVSRDDCYHIRAMFCYLIA